MQHTFFAANDIESIFLTKNNNLKLSSEKNCINKIKINKSIPNYMFYSQ